eukprot:CAMPEP_0172446096 /NCGR_PEP_ID=MMETSP1065-20121228/5767_1 /TAXON_ID=265537 /ORGANISM="Amphiprora paludosa, Strain CCMP125" /LENGTH=900 /DNA_ID=CAMNT_0013197127 /DNA_START=35 /DNA_END=2737 /DNA_ORIENTATION=+
MSKPEPILRTASSEDGPGHGSADGAEGRKVSFAAKARISGGTKDETDAVVPTKKEGTRSATIDSYSDASSATSGESGGLYEVIEYDPSQQVRSADEDMDEDFLGIEPAIGENTPAAEALRASAAVRVSRVGKAARAVNIQAVRKLVKRATGTTKHGVVKGKPPRLPPQHGAGSDEENDDSSVEPINEAHVHQRNVQQQPSPQGVTKEHMPDDVVAGTVEAGKKVLGSVDPHDMLKTMKWRKKKKGESNKPKSYTKGKVIDGEHELYTLSIAVMIGVRTSISKTNIVINSGPSKRWVLPQDYRTTEKYEFRPKGSSGMPSHQLAHTFKFKDYAPVVFAYLRRMYGINEFDFLISVCGNANFIEFISNAKSGQFFFYSSDGRYMIKTMTNAECRFLRRILPDYFKHCSENPNTMITRFFGMYRVKLYHLRRNVKFVIMNSVYYTDKYLQTFYDLKGSVLGRDAKPGQAVKKDNDLRRALNEGDALAMRPDARERVRKQLEKDTVFLEQMGIMDYSMLVGVHHKPPAEDPSIATTGFRTSSRKSHRRLNTDSDMQLLESESRRLLLTPRQASNPSLMTGEETPLSNRKLGEDVLAFEDGLDDDESSYLMGSDRRGKEAAHRVNEETEQKKQATVEKLYWPFNRLFDIHGHRRLKDVTSLSSSVPDECLRGFDVQRFEAPLSDRKDGGFEMDTTGLSLPLIYKGDDGSNKLYEGKIFYMGIIDILQEYNSRKVVEAQYRLLQSSGKTEASCVDPATYGHRFIEFFEEYTSRKDEDTGVEMTLDLHESRGSSSPGLVVLSPKDRGDSSPTTPNQSGESDSTFSTPNRKVAGSRGNRNESPASSKDSPNVVQPKKSPSKKTPSPSGTPTGKGLSIVEPSKKSPPSDGKGSISPSRSLFGGRRKVAK